MAAEYGMLKRQLAVLHSTDIDQYIEGKTAFLLSVLAKCNLSPDELASIEEANRA